MKQAIRVALTLALVQVAGIARAADEKAPLVYKAAANQSARYKSEGTLHLEVMGMKVNLDMKEIEKVAYSAPLPNGDIKMERESESSETSINNQKLPPSPDGTKERTTVVIHKDGTIVSYHSSSPEKDSDKTQVRLFVATSPVFIEKPVGVGDKWVIDYKGDVAIGTRNAHADYEVQAFEKSAGADSVKIKMVYKETEGSPAMTCTNTFWVEKTSGDTVAGEYDIDGLQLEMGGAMATANGKVKSERLSGSPMGGGKAPDPKAEAAAKKDKTIEEVVKDYEKLPGAFTLYRKKEQGRDTIYMELREDQLDKLNMMQVTFSSGNGGSVEAGRPIDDILFKFVKQQDDKILFVVPNIFFKADEKSPISRAVKRSFPDAYLDSYRIEAKDEKRKALLINISELFRGDLAQISARVGGYGMDREKTYIASIKNFPENMVVETAYHFFRGGGPMTLSMLLSSGGLADPRSMPLKVDYLLYPLPETGYKPRLADPRVGYFLVDHETFDNDNTQDNTNRYIIRWNLEKQDPKAKVSPPKKPIVFWLDNAIPLEYRDAIRDGILYWNKAFDKLGYKEAVQVKQMPDNADWDHADMRHNVVRWITSPWSGGANAIALFRPNPITGEILNASINVDANWTRYNKMEKGVLVDPALQFADPQPVPAGVAWDPRYCEIGKEGMDQAWFGDMALSMLGAANPKLNPKEYTNAFLRELVSHEMGHCLGLRHNFIASCYHSLEELKNPEIVKKTGITASVMDYTPFNISALKQIGVDFFTPTIGPYDEWAIEYGYTSIDNKTTDGELWKLKQIASKCNEPGHAYQSDELADSFDPAVTRYDLSSQPLAYWMKNLDVSRYMLFHLATRLPKPGDSYWEFTRNFNRMLNFYTRAAKASSRYIGGLHVNRNHKGDTGEKPTQSPVTAEEQRRALALLNEYIFSESAFSFPRDYYGKLTTDPFPDLIMMILSGGGGADFPIQDTLAGVQRAALNQIFSSLTLKRIVNNEFKVGDPVKAFTLPYLYHNVSASVWSELDGKRNISALRRQLQRNFLDIMIRMVTEPGGAPDDARMLAWDQLRNLRSRIAVAKTSTKDTYTRVHLEESQMRINRALEAKQVYAVSGGGGGGGFGSLFGGEGKVPAGAVTTPSGASGAGIAAVTQPAFESAIQPQPVQSQPEIVPSNLRLRSIPIPAR